MQKEFLKLAGLYMTSRWEVCGHVVEGSPYAAPDMLGALQGMGDYSAEMALVFDDVVV